MRNVYVSGSNTPVVNTVNLSGSESVLVFRSKIENLKSSENLYNLKNEIRQYKHERSFGFV